MYNIRERGMFGPAESEESDESDESVGSGPPGY